MIIFLNIEFVNGQSLPNKYRLRKTGNDLEWVEHDGAEVDEAGVLVQPAVRGAQHVLVAARAHSPGQSFIHSFSHN